MKCDLNKVYKKPPTNAEGYKIIYFVTYSAESKALFGGSGMPLLYI